MKIVVSSRTLQMQVRKALDNKSEVFTVGYKDQCITFSGIDDAIPLMTTARAKDDYIGRIQPDQWFKIFKFIDQLQEQPIVLEFTHYMHTDIHEKPEILMSQITKLF